MNQLLMMMRPNHHQVSHLLHLRHRLHHHQMCIRHQLILHHRYFLVLQYQNQDYDFHNRDSMHLRHPNRLNLLLLMG